MQEIKIYEELSYIYTYDDKVYPTPIAVKDLEKLLNGNLKFINLGSDLIAISSIKRVESKKVDSVENMILQVKDTDLRNRLSKEVNRRKENGDRVNIEIAQNILSRLQKQ